MFDPPRYRQSTFSLVFPEQRDVTSSEKQIYERLRPAYFPAQLVRVANDSDPDVPRLAFGSQHGHSQILIGASSAVLNVVYSPDWQTKISDARQYVLDRAALVFDAVETLGEIQLLFCGSVTRAQLRSDAADEDVVQVVADVFMAAESTDPYHDVILRMTTVVEDLFFNNITVQNYRSWNVNPTHGGTLRLSRRQAVERGVEVVGDFNSRYAFNEDRDFVVTREAAFDVIDRNLATVAEAISTITEARA